MQKRKIVTLITSKEFFEYAFSLLILLSFFLWLINVVISGENSFQFRLFFLNCEDFIADTTNVAIYSSELDPFHNPINSLGQKSYPPITYIVSYFLSRIVDYKEYLNDPVSLYVNKKFITIFIILTIIQIVFLYIEIEYYKEGSHTVKMLTGLAVIVSSPVLFTIERGNTILFTVILVGMFIFTYDSDEKIKKEVGLLALALAFNFKISPAFMGILLIIRKDYRAALRAAFYALSIFLISFIPINGGISAIPQMFKNVKTNLDEFSGTTGTTIDAAVYNLTRKFGGLDEQMLINSMSISRIITYIAAIILCFAAYKVYKFKWQKIMALTSCLLILPSHSGEYCILYIIPAIILFLNASEHRMKDIVYLFVGILFMWDFYITDVDWRQRNLSIGMLIMVITLLVDAVRESLVLLVHKKIRKGKMLDV